MSAPGPSHHEDEAATAKDLDDSIHALAQPLTALLFLLDLGRLNSDAAAMRATLDDARTECLRAIKALEAVRSAAHALGNTGELS